MKFATKKLRSPLKWHGGKSYLARRFNALMPYRPLYIEPFAGGLSVLLNRPRASREIVNDLDPWLARFWEVMTNEERFARMWNRVSRTDYRAESFALAKSWLRDQAQPEPEIPWDLLSRSEFAAFFLIRNRMSRGGLGKDFAWSDRLRGGQPGDVNAWKTFVGGEILHVHSRVAGVEVHNDKATTIIKAFDAPDALIYCDPPYLQETRTAKKAYGAFEMSRPDHRTLLETLLACKGKVFLSGYRSELYDFAFAESGWARHEFSMPNHSGQGKSKQRRIECLWESPSAARSAGPAAIPSVPLARPAGMLFGDDQ
jgi:DNA adenine methylase